MKRPVIVLIIIGLLAGMALAAPAEAKKKKKKKPTKVTRKAESAYDTPAIGHPDVIVGCSGSTGCATFAVSAKEAFATFKIEDSLGTPVYAVGGQDLDGDNFADTSFSFCGQTEEPVAIEPGFAINIFISAGPGTSPACPGAASSGVVKAVFSNLP